MGLGFQTVPRMTLCLLLVLAKSCFFLVEQPSQSLLYRHPRFEWFTNRVAWASWWIKGLMSLFLLTISKPETSKSLWIYHAIWDSWLGWNDGSIEDLKNDLTVNVASGLLRSLLDASSWRVLQQAICVLWKRFNYDWSWQRQDVQVWEGKQNTSDDNTTHDLQGFLAIALWTVNSFYLENMPKNAIRKLLLGIRW